MNMSIPEITNIILTDSNIAHEIITSDSHESFLAAAADSQIPPQQLVRTLVIRSHGRLMMLAIRASDLLDFSELTNVLGEEITLQHNYHRGVTDGDANRRTPIASMLEFDLVIDEALVNEPHVYFDSGLNWSFVKVTGSDFAKLNSKAKYSHFSCPPEQLYSVGHNDNDEENKLLSFTPKRIHQRVEETLDLPAMPTIAQEVMRLRVDHNAGAADLAAVVEQDPSLAAQVVSWASSPYYGYQGKIDSIHTAISRVLGFDLVLNLALGISVGKVFNVTNDGPLGIKSYWRQSVYCATLCEKLCSFIRGKTRPSRGLVYLSGLLHNFGQLILGHLFPPQFYLINRYVEMNPHIPLADIERYLLGTTHLEVGEWLMQSWNMPDELISAVRWHHHEEFSGNEALYSNLVLVANRLLKRIDIGDASQLILPEPVLQTIGIQEDDAFKALDLIVADEAELNAIAQQMVA